MRWLIGGVVGLLLCLPLVAEAQYVEYGPYEPYTSTVYNEGPGIKFGHDGLVFHPGLSTELGYDSNVLLSNTPAGAGLFRLRLHIDLATLPPQRLDDNAHPNLEFRLGGAVEYRQYFDSNNPGNPVGLAYQINGVSNISLAIKPRDPFSVRFYNDFIYTHDARNLEVATTQTFAPRIYERIGGLMVLRPYNGPLELGLGEAFRLDYFVDDTLAGDRSYANEVTAYAQLKVLEQTRLKLEARSSYINYYNTSALDPTDTSAHLPSEVPLRVTLGISTLIKNNFGLTAYAGYGNSFFYGVNQQTGLQSSGDVSYSGFIAGAEARVRLIGKMRLALGWARDFYDSLFASYFVDDRFYLDYDHNVWRGLFFHVHFDTYLRSYGTLVTPAFLGYAGYQDNGAPTTTRSDVLLTLGAEVNYRVLSWMQVGVSYNLLDDITDFTFINTGGGTTPAAFIKHSVLANIDIAY